MSEDSPSIRHQSSSDLYYGITNISLSNFKSIPELSDPQIIELAPLTLICGENSSGKSTLLHSILLMIQSIASEKETDDELPLNGKLIKLNNFNNILHFKSTSDMEQMEYLAFLDNKSMDIGIDFTRLISNDKPGSLNSDIKINTKLTTELEYDEIGMGPTGKVLPFPRNQETSIQSKSTALLGDSILGELNFSTLPVKDKILVFDAEDGSLLKEFTNPTWNCKYQQSYPKEMVNYRTKDISYKGVRFHGGIPSEVSRRVKLVEFLSEKAKEQVEEVLKDEEFVRDHLYEWLNNSFINDGGKSVSMDDYTENESIKKEFIDAFVGQFQIASKDILSDSGIEIEENHFTLNRNTTPWIGSNVRKSYLNKTQLAEDLIKCVAQYPFAEYSELLESILYEAGMCLSANAYIDRIKDDYLNFSDSDEFDIEDFAEELKPTIFAEFQNLLDDPKSSIELENSLFEIFDKLFNSDDDIFYVNLDIEEAPAEDEIKVNEILSELKDIAKGVKYIGPLRMLENDEVRIENFDDNIPMGLKGEYFFNYYEYKFSHQAYAPVYITQIGKNDAICFQHYTTQQEAEEVTIEEKFNEALNYFEIAERFYTKYNPETDSVVGYIKPIGLDKEIKMTELGVGFSQLAPIILLCLTSEPGTTILLEQPELHLHPKVQQKFADFIIKMTEEYGLQIILETHSDHMLNRIRRRIAQAKLEKNDSSISERCTILFAEREDGVTQFRNANLTNSGTYDLTDFPKGFFDQGAEDAFFILKASMEDENG